MTEHTTAPPPAGYAGWAIVELMGHRQRAGLVREAEMFGTKLLRIDIPLIPPKPEPPQSDQPPEPPLAELPVATEFYGGASIYALRPVTEAVARAAVLRIGDPRPAAPLGYRSRDADSAAAPRQLAYAGDDDGEA
jgi:hypothetical protein